jgi:hypothetical protein
MNIIFKENSQEIREKYTVLDLDTFQMPDGSVHTACCVVENIPIEELSQIDSLRETHEGLIANYAKKNWTACEQALQQLLGKWGGELDTYYADLQTRVERLKTLDLDDNWSPVIAKI